MPSAGPDNPTCPECGVVGGGLGGCTSTLMAYDSFIDSDGKTHHHNPNYVDQAVTCQNGHHYSYSMRNTCWCGWQSKTWAEVTAKT